MRGSQPAAERFKGIKEILGEQAQLNGMNENPNECDEQKLADSMDCSAMGDTVADLWTCLDMVDKKYREILTALADIEAIGSETLKVYEKIVNKGETTSIFDISQINSAYVKPLEAVNRRITKQQVKFTMESRNVAFPKEPYLHVVYEQHRYTCSLLWDGKDHLNAINNANDTRLRAYCFNAHPKVEAFDVLSLSVTANNIEILRCTMQFFFEYKHSCVEKYKALHPAPLTKKQWRQGPNEYRVLDTKTRVASPYAQMLNATRYKKGQMVGQTANSTFLFVATPNAEGNFHDCQYHDPVTRRIVDRSTVTDQDLVICTTEQFFSRISWLLHRVYCAHVKMQQHREKCKGIQPIESMDEVIAQLADAKLYESDQEDGEDAKKFSHEIHSGDTDAMPTRKRRRNDKDD